MVVNFLLKSYFLIFILKHPILLQKIPKIASQLESPIAQCIYYTLYAFRNNIGCI